MGRLASLVTALVCSAIPEPELLKGIFEAITTQKATFLWKLTARDQELLGKLSLTLPPHVRARSFACGRKIRRVEVSHEAACKHRQPACLSTSLFSASFPPAVTGALRSFAVIKLQTASGYD